jgi:hypothetical protein
MATNHFQNLCDTWENLDYYQRTNKLTTNQINSFEEVKNFLEMQINSEEQIIETANSGSNIDSIIDKLKGS